MEIYLVPLEQANNNLVPLDNLSSYNHKHCQSEKHLLSGLTSSGDHQKLK